VRLREVLPKGLSVRRYTVSEGAARSGQCRPNNSLGSSASVISMTDQLAADQIKDEESQSDVARGNALEISALQSKAAILQAHSLDIKLSIGGEVLQHSNTRELIFRIPDLIAYISSITFLQPADIISTGTPSGVGHGRTPHRWLRAGETIITEIQGIGQLVNPVVAEGNSWSRFADTAGTPAAEVTCLFGDAISRNPSRASHVSSLD
jgi:hypothetical protein